MTNVERMPKRLSRRSLDSRKHWGFIVVRIACHTVLPRLRDERARFVICFPFCASCVTFPFMRRAIYPGSFDPITNGHLDVIERARKLFDEVVVAVAHNDEKQPLFSLNDRLDLLRETAGKIDNVRIAEFEGLLVEFARNEEAGVVIRGLRAISDFEFEFQMALMNRKLDSEVETIFLMPKEEYTYLSSRIVKEIARLGGDVSGFVPACVAKALSRKFG
jgi:pantetheine-phosphate adenylyltransferase